MFAGPETGWSSVFRLFTAGEIASRLVTPPVCKRPATAQTCMISCFRYTRVTLHIRGSALRHSIPRHGPFFTELAFFMQAPSHEPLDQEPTSPLILHPLVTHSVDGCADLLTRDIGRSVNVNSQVGGPLSNSFNPQSTHGRWNWLFTQPPSHLTTLRHSRSSPEQNRRPNAGFKGS
ncbi:hypothetical protein EXIGLDRAFT_39784 [Exidia glandulosa HHB12029]|uniref:Uncharacterized protein n=1 Tax=Exidia glandulosa HHB12029 TaxID=1314781 RepID=A0A165INQ2_EXIGL|nr:hypothetical protein EXIGLDRAFT_39784 [Exidia glandulosa HHB12029]